MVIIAKVIFNEFGRRSIIKDVEYTEEAFPDFAIVPDELTECILATEGFCDLELSEDGKAVVSFSAREIPELPGPVPSADSVWDELDAAYTAGYREGYTEGVNSAYEQ